MRVCFLKDDYMRWGQFSKVPNELLTNLPVIEKQVKHTMLQAKRKTWRMSLRLINPVVQISDCSADDFVRNRSTIMIEFDAYKMPRIVKRLLTHKL